MMTIKGREERDLEEALEAVREFERKEAEKAKLPPVQAKKALVIRVAPPNVPDQPKKNQQRGKKADANKTKTKAPPVYYQTKGLEKYSRVDLNTVGVAFC